MQLPSLVGVERLMMSYHKGRLPADQPLRYSTVCHQCPKSIFRIRGDQSFFPLATGRELSIDVRSASAWVSAVMPLAELRTNLT